MRSRFLVSLSVAALSLVVAAGMPAIAAPPAGRMQPHRPSAAQMQAMVNRGVDAQVNDLATKLNLTASQKAKARAIFEETGRQIMPLFQNRSANPQTTMAKVQSISKAGQDRFMKILTPAQRKKYEAYRATQMARMRSRMRQGGGMRPGGMRPGGHMMAPGGHMMAPRH